MKQKLLCFLLGILLIGSAHAQDRRISGKVTSSEDGVGIVGVSVQAIGTSAGTQTNEQGNYVLIVPETATSIRFVYLGFTSQTVDVGNSDIMNVVLSPDEQALDEVVVTALGIERASKSIGYSVQAVQGEDLTQARQSDLNTALAGKIAGVQVMTGSGARFGTATIRIRGVNNLSGGNPIYVVDGVVTDPEYINNDDVESLTVLKGPAATALYGQRGSEGAVVIRTKRAKAGATGIGLEISQATSFENVYLLPAYQNEYGGGYNQNFSTFEYDPTRHPDYLAQFDGANYYNYAADESWGPRMDGTLHVPWYAWDPTHPRFGEQVPFSPQPDNVKNFFETGVSANTNVAFSKANEDYNTRFSYTNISRKGVIPNSDQGKHMLSANAGLNLTDRLTVTTNINFVYEKRFNFPIDGYSSGPQSSFNQWFARNLNMKDLKEGYKRPDGSYRSWNIQSPTNLDPLYWDNPYTHVYENVQERINRRLYGNVTLAYEITDNLTASAIARGNFLNFNSQAQVASHTLSLDRYAQNLEARQELNYVGSLSYDETFNDFQVGAAIFGEYRRNQRRFTNANTNGGLSIPDLYTLGASKDRPTVTSFFSDYKVNSLYGYVTLGYRDLLFLELNARNDWSSTLPEGNNSYLYGGVSGSFIFSELMQADWLSYGKLRASIARVGTDTDPYDTQLTYSVGNPYGSYPLLTVPNALPNLTLRPTLSTSYEIGTELRFLRDRLLFDINYYNRSAKDQIIPLTVSSTSGYSSALVNAGEIDNWGWEFALGGTPIRNDNFSWDLNANIAFNRNQVVDIYGSAAEGNEIRRLPIGLDGAVTSFGFVGAPRITAYAEKGAAYGRLVGSGFARNENGEKLIDENGFYIVEEGDVDMGSILPDFTGGFTTSLSYKGITAGFSIDFQKGGRYMSISSMFGNGSGLYEETAGLNDKGNPKRDPVEEGGGVLLDGVKEDGTPNDKYVSVQDLYRDRLAAGALWEHWVYDASYIKMREISVGYKFPDRLFTGTPFKNVSFALIAQNPFLIYAQNRNFDPSILEDSWFEGGQLPNVRSLGFSLKFGL